MAINPFDFMMIMLVYKNDCFEIVISGSVINSDLSASTLYIKSKVKKLIFTEQKSGCKTSWSLANLLPQ